MTQDRTRLRELFDELHSVGKQCDDPNLRTLIVGAATVLIAQDDERAALLAERDALVRERDMERNRADLADRGMRYLDGELVQARANYERASAERDALAAMLRECRDAIVAWNLAEGECAEDTALVNRVNAALEGAKGE
ncbi:MAG: hypothetical protein ACK52I_19225 [Pseudomonadota bacterium]